VATTGKLARWQLAGDAAADYQRLLVPALFADLAERLLDTAGLRSGERVLDVACGTGAVARAARARVGPTGRVEGVDLNDGMLAVARAAGDGVEYHRGDATALPVPDGAFDLVTCQQGLQFVEDRDAALREARRALAADGRAAFAVWRSIEHSPVFARFATSLGRHIGPDAETIMRSPFQLADGEELRRLALGAGFAEATTTIHVATVRFASPAAMLEAEIRSSPLAAALPGRDDDDLVPLLDELDAALADHRDDAGVAFPIETHLVLAQAARSRTGRG
jgi:ubiquinone/menaquinone biosynthesis C-methylase UbiE